MYELNIAKYALQLLMCFISTDSGSLEKTFHSKISTSLHNKSEQMFKRVNMAGKSLFWDKQCTALYFMLLKVETVPQ